MLYLYFDASALVKKYVAEQGSFIIHSLFKQVPMKQMMGLNIGVGECLSVLVRRRNAAMISLNTYSHAILKLKIEILNSTDFRLLPIDDQAIKDSFSFIEKYSLNATDAIVLSCALEQEHLLSLDEHPFVFLASDTRLLKSAQTEGLTTFNPETASELDIVALLNLANKQE
ncbi:MAG: type II toxin-antitoxin system VapC family toxin [Fimbriimonadia bacterium]|nr:type II toxin-antitoxin system VapC family toxin [Fimbriimonadia bacterium]